MKIDLNNKDEIEVIENIIKMNKPFIKTPTQAVRFALSKYCKKEVVSE